MAGLAAVPAALVCRPSRPLAAEPSTHPQEVPEARAVVHPRVRAGAAERANGAAAVAVVLPTARAGARCHRRPPVGVVAEHSSRAAAVREPKHAAGSRPGWLR